jgi:hypothetical protein
LPLPQRWWFSPRWPSSPGAKIQTPSLGLLLFIAVPVVFVSGLVLVPIGVWRQHRRIAQQKAIDEWDRCHTDTLKMEDGRTINEDCERCHAMA